MASKVMLRTPGTASSDGRTPRAAVTALAGQLAQERTKCNSTSPSGPDPLDLDVADVGLQSGAYLFVEHGLDRGAQHVVKLKAGHSAATRSFDSSRFFCSMSMPNNRAWFSPKIFWRMSRLIGG